MNSFDKSLDFEDIDETIINKMFEQITEKEEEFIRSQENNEGQAVVEIRKIIKKWIDNRE